MNGYKIMFFDKKVKILKVQNKQKRSIHDLDKSNYSSKCESLKIENNLIKKASKL